MKKALYVVIMLLLAAPAMGALSISCNDEGSGRVSVSYSGADSANLPRAFALDITLSGGCIVKAGSLGDLSADFDIYPGTIQITDGNIVSAGTPVAPASDPGAGEGEGADNMTTEQGSLYASGDPAPATSGMLLSFEADANGTGAASCTVSVAVNGTRGKVVLEDGSSVDLSTSCEVDFGGSPACWSYDCFSCGDGNGDCDLTFADLNLVINGWPPNPYNPCADYDKSTDMTFADLNVLINNWPPNGACANCGSCTPLP